MSTNVVWQRILSFFPELVKGLSGAAPTVDWTQGSTQSVTLNAATVTPTFVNPPGGCNLTLVATQDGTGGRAVAWPGSVTWIGGTPPVLLSGAGQTTLVNFYFDGTTYLGWLATAGSPSSLLPWTDVAAGTTLAASLSKPNLAFDTAGPQSNVTLPTAAQMANADGFQFLVKCTGTMLSPVIVNAGAGTTVELVGGALGPGNFGAATYLPYEAMIAGFKYDKATTQWKLFSLSLGSASSSLKQASWAVDYAAGNNSNSGAPGFPLAQVSEIRRRWSGGVVGARPTLPGINIAVAVNGDVPLASQFSDPVCALWDLDGSLGLNLQITFAPTIKRAGTILAVANAFARTATGEQTVTDAGIADWTSDVDHLLSVTSGGKKTVCWVTRALAAPARGVLSSAYDSASSAAITTAINLGLAPDTVAPADTYTIEIQAKCYLGSSSLFRVSPGSLDTGTTAQANVSIVGAHGLAQENGDVLAVEGDASFFGNTQIGGSVTFVDCQIDQIRSVQEGGVNFFNCFASPNAQDVLSSPKFSGVILSGYVRNRTLILLDSWTVDQDFFAIGLSLVSSGDPAGASQGCIIGDYGHFLHGAAATSFAFISRGGTIVQEAIYNAQSVWYGETGGAGQPVIAMEVFSHYACQNATSAASWVTDQGAGAFVKLGAANQNGVFWNLATSTYLPVGGLANTITNIDAARPGGFGGKLSNPDLGITVSFSV